jgi:hypothetical protein
MQFYNKTSFRDARQDSLCILFFLESPESGIRFRQRAFQNVIV